ncbi:hypothetical protein O9992_28120 [Vibrio lentus]|nr:hypothetical protein [Vibrio lentus]
MFERAHHTRSCSPPERSKAPNLCRVESNLGDLNQEILDVKNEEVSGTLTIYSRPTFAQLIWFPRIAEFKQRYPAIH